MKSITPFIGWKRRLKKQNIRMLLGILSNSRRPMKIQTALILIRPAGHRLCGASLINTRKILKRAYSHFRRLRPKIGIMAEIGRGRRYFQRNDQSGIGWRKPYSRSFEFRSAKD